MDFVVSKLFEVLIAVFWFVAGESTDRLAGSFPFSGPYSVIGAAWIVFFLYWLVAAFTSKRTQKRQPSGQRLILLIYMVGASSLLFEDRADFGVLSHRFVPGLPWIAETGAVMAIAGVAFAIWARNHIGRNWSGMVTIKEDHQLIRTGPYSRIRHPIYTGILLAVLGSALANGEYRSLLAFGLIAIGLAYKAKTEEMLLAEHFGSAFQEHKRLTGFFLPRLS